MQEQQQNLRDILNFLLEESKKMEFEKDGAIIITRIFQILSEEYEKTPSLEEFKKIYMDLLKKALNFYEINFESESEQSTTKLQLLKDFTLPTDSLNRKIFDVGFVYGKEESIYLRKDEQITFIASTIYDELLKNNSILKKLTSHDKRVMVTLANLYNSQNTPYLAITTAQIYRVMNNSKANPKAEAKKQIEDSLKKMAQIRIEIDKSKLERAEIKEKVKAIPLSGNLIDFQQWAVLDQKSNKYYSIYRFMTEPILFTFARCLGDVWSIPNRYLNIKGVGQDLGSVLADYMATMNRGNMSRMEVLFETIFEKLEINENNFKSQCSLLNKKRKIREQAEKYLEACKGDLIEEYKIEKNKIVLYKKINLK